MTAVPFVHSDPDFNQLIEIVSQANGIAPSLIEKDYWVTHVLWALHETGLAIWFKGGTSLSKGFGLIQRFSEDLDLMILPGTVNGLPEVSNWKSANKGPTAERASFYDKLLDSIQLPDLDVQRDANYVDKDARSANYLAYYSGHYLDELADAVSPFVRLEVGRARNAPSVPMPLSSFVHDHLQTSGELDQYQDNRPKSVICVHPLVTLLEKLDAMMRRYSRATIQPDSFVRHYEDGARIVNASNDLPKIEMSINALVEEMIGTKDLGRKPSPDEPALLLDDPDKRAAVEKAYERIGPMFWGERIRLDDACAVIRGWLATLGGIRGRSRAL